MEFDPSQVMGWVAAIIWPFIRVSAMLMAMPVIGSNNVPIRVRLAITLAVTIVIAPQLSNLPSIDPLSIESWLLVLEQILIGVAMGFALQLVFSAVVIGGQVVALQMGLGFASMVDPSSGMQMPMISQLYMLAVILLFLAFNGHLIIIEMVANSFVSLPVGKGFLSSESLWLLINWGGDMFASGLLVAIPTVGALLIVNISFGIMTRASPQLNIFAIGFPFMIGIGLAVMLVTLPTLTSQTQKMFDDIFELIRSIIGI